MLIQLVEETGFEPVKAKPTDLQSVPFGQLGNSSKLLWSWREDLNPQPTDYKSVALPIELRQLIKTKWRPGRDSNPRPPA